MFYFQQKKQGTVRMYEVSDSKVAFYLDQVNIPG